MLAYYNTYSNSNGSNKFPFAIVNVHHDVLTKNSPTNLWKELNNNSVPCIGYFTFNICCLNINLCLLSQHIFSPEIIPTLTRRFVQPNQLPLAGWQMPINPATKKMCRRVSSAPSTQPKRRTKYFVEQCHHLLYIVYQY